MYGKDGICILARGVALAFFQGVQWRRSISKEEKGFSMGSAEEEMHWPVLRANCVERFVLPDRKTRRRRYFWGRMIVTPSE